MATITLVDTQPEACNFIEGRTRRMWSAFIEGADARATKHDLVKQGFLGQDRENQREIVAFTDCFNCHACVPVRVDLASYKPGKSARGKLREPENASLNMEVLTAGQAYRHASEMYALYHDFMTSRFHESLEAKRDERSFGQRVLAASHIFVFRDPAGRLKGFTLAETHGAPPEQDIIMNVSTYDRGNMNPDISPGYIMRVRALQWSGAQGMRHAYLGYWTEHRGSLHYKVDFKAIEGINDSRVWSSIGTDRGMAGPTAGAMRARLSP